MLGPKLLLLGHSVIVMHDQTISWRDSKFAYSSVIQFIDSLVEGFPINVLSVTL